MMSLFEDTHTLYLGSETHRLTWNSLRAWNLSAFSLLISLYVRRDIVSLLGAFLPCDVTSNRVLSPPEEDQ